MVTIVLHEEARLLMQSPLYRFTTEQSDDQGMITVLRESTQGAYQPFSILEQKQGYVYLDLFSYSFMLQLQQVIQAHEVINGVVRMRRTTHNFSYMLEDVFVLTELFGEMKHCSIRTHEKAGMRYMILLCQFGEQMMAHLEYVSGAQRIEFEWSSNQHILEFDSAEMTGDLQNNQTLFYNVDAILKNAMEWNAYHEQKLATIQAQLQGGRLT